MHDECEALSSRVTEHFAKTVARGGWTGYERHISESRTLFYRGHEINMAGF